MGVAAKKEADEKEALAKRIQDMENNPPKKEVKRIVRRKLRKRREPEPEPEDVKLTDEVLFQMKRKALRAYFKEQGRKQNLVDWQIKGYVKKGNGKVKRKERSS